MCALAPHSYRALIVLLVAFLPCTPFRTEPVAAAVTTRESVDSFGGQSNGDSYSPSLTPDGRFVVFLGYGSTLVANDFNGVPDVFVRDRLLATTELVSVASSGIQGNMSSLGGGLSPDGRFVVFNSYADNLVAGDTNGNVDVFLRDRLTGTTECVSITASGLPGNEASGVDRLGVSADGRYVVFFSLASNLVAGDTNGKWDVFVRDRLTATTQRVSLGLFGAEADDDSMRIAVLTPDGRYVGFESFATNIVAGDTNGVRDAFLHDRLLGTTERVSLSAGGAQANAWSGWTAMTPDARYVVFDSTASNLVAGDTNGVFDVFVRDRLLATTVRASVATSGIEGNQSTFGGGISDDGRFVVLMTQATNLVVPDTNGGEDVLLRDLNGSTTTRVSVDSALVQANGSSFHPAMSADGCQIAFVSGGTNVVPGDTNLARDVFLHDRQCCGNGAIESPEQCDAGALNGTSGACCSSTCTFEPATTACQPSAGPCDPAEYCTGVSPTCPADARSPSGTPCADDGLPCTSDSCDGASALCQHTAVPDGTPCDDFDSCTGGETCIGGVCTYATADLECVNHYLCYRARRTASTPAFVSVTPVALGNAYEAGTFTIKKPDALCTPVDKNSEGMVDPALHMNSYGVRRLTGGPLAGPLHGLKMRDQLGLLTVDLQSRHRLLVPAHKALGAPALPPAIGSADHHVCYRVRVTPGTPKLAKGIVVTALDQFQTLVLQIRKPSRLCLPTDKGGELVVHPVTHLMCYQVAVDAAPHVPIVGVIHTADQFGARRLDTVAPKELCLPSFREP